MQVGGHSIWPFFILAATCYTVRNCTSPTNGVCKATDICQCNPGYIGNRDSVLAMLLNPIESSVKNACLFPRCKWITYNLVLFGSLKFAPGTGMTQALRPN